MHHAANITVASWEGLHGAELAEGERLATGDVVQPLPESLRNRAAATGAGYPARIKVQSIDSACPLTHSCLAARPVFIPLGNQNAKSTNMYSYLHMDRAAPQARNLLLTLG